MKIGLYDYDLCTRPKTKKLNVEIMKLGSYYESRGCQVDVLSPEDNIFYYDKIIVVTNVLKPNESEMKKFLSHPNIEFFGPSMNNGKFVSFDNKEIDYIEPQFKFYNNLLKYFYKKGIYKAEDIAELKNKKFVRVFPGASAINIDKVMTGEKIYLVDNYIFDKNNWEETLKYLAIFNRYFVFVNNQNIYNIEDLKNFKKMLDYKFIGLKGIIKIDGIEELKEFLKEGKEILDEITPSRFVWEMAYNKDNNYNEQFYKREFYNTLLKAQIFNENNIEIIETTFLDCTKFEFTLTIFTLLKDWILTRKCTKESFNEYIFRLAKKKKTRDLYLKFLEANPEYKSLINIIYKREEK